MNSQRRFRWLRITCSLVMLLLFALLALWSLGRAALHNLGMLQLLQEWKGYDSAASTPNCQAWLEQSDARTWYEQVLKIDPLNQRAYLALGRAVWLEGRCDTAVDLWKQASTPQSQDIIAEWELANALYASGNLEQAIGEYRRLGADSYFYARGVQADLRGDHAGASRGYELSVAIRARRDPVQMLAAQYLSQEQPAEARRLWLAFAASTQIDDPDHWWALGQAAELDQEWADALVNYDRSITLQTHPYLLYIAYSQAGVTSLRVPDYSRGKAYFYQALSLRPKDILTHLRLGELEQLQGHYEAAQDWYQRAATLDPSSELPPYYLGLLYRQREDESRALQFFLTAENLNPNNPHILFYLALSTYEAGSLSGAIDYLERAIDVNPGSSAGWERVLLTWYLEAERCPDALSVAQHFLALQAVDADTQELIRRTKELCR